MLRISIFGQDQERAGLSMQVGLVQSVQHFMHETTAASLPPWIKSKDYHPSTFIHIQTRFSVTVFFALVIV